MKRRTLTPIVAAAALLGAPPAYTQCVSVGWTISASATDPYDNETTFSGPVDTGYLWFLCDASPQDPGLSAVQFSLASTNPVNTIAAFTPMNGFLNAGDPVNLLLAVGGCPTGPILAGSILVLVDGPGSICIEPPPGDEIIQVNCMAMITPADFHWIGLDFGG